MLIWDVEINYFNPKDVIYRKNQLQTEIYIIIEGSVKSIELNKKYVQGSIIGINDSMK